jgi:uncharacterized membrane protein (UPF0127 family)
MKRAKVLRKDGRALVEQCDVAENALERMVGLLPRKELGAGEALWLAPCTSVHTCFMRFEIDVAFVDRKGKVIALYSRLPPWRHSWIHLWAAGALEAPAGFFERVGLQKGEVLEICPLF